MVLSKAVSCTLGKKSLLEPEDLFSPQTQLAIPQQLFPRIDQGSRLFSNSSPSGICEE